MSIDEFEPLDAALDAALARVLIPPAPPDGFQIRLQAALARVPAGEERAVRRSANSGSAWPSWMPTTCGYAAVRSAR